MELESVNVKFDETRGVFLIEINTTKSWGEGANIYKLCDDLKLPQGIKNEVLEQLNAAKITI